MSIEQEEVDRLDEIIQEMVCLLDEAKDIIRNGPNHTYERAKAYPIGHIDAALTHDGNYVNTHDITLSDILDELRGQVEPEEDEDLCEEDEEVEEEIPCVIHGQKDCPRC